MDIAKQDITLRTRGMKILNSETLIFAFALVMAVALVGGLVVVPSIVIEVDAKCTDGFKKNGDECKDKKPKKH